MVKTRFSIHVITLLVFLISGFLFNTANIHGEESTTLGSAEGSVSIQWEDLESSYRVQVRRSGQVFIDTLQTANSLSLNLAPGEYEYKVIVLSPFGKLISESEWLPLEVQRAWTPYFRLRAPKVIWEGDTGIRLTLESTYIREQTVFNLTYGDNSIQVEWTGESDIYTLAVPDGSAGPGSWNLEANDPSGRSFTVPEALVVRPRRSPEVASLDTRTAAAAGLVPVVIQGSAFDQDMTVRFQGPGGDIGVTALEISEGRSAVAYLNLEGAVPGDYDLVVTNPAGEETRVEKILTVTEPEEVPVFKRQPRFGFQMGWAPMWINIPDSDSHLPSYLAFDFAGLFQSGMDTPFFRGLGLETRFMIGISGPADVPDSSIDFISSLDVSGYYRPLVKGKVAPVFLLGVGNLWSGYADKYEIHNIFFIRTGIGMDITNIHDELRLGINFNWGFTDEIIPMISVMFRRGMSY
jgi:hypothetical protein